MRPCAASCAKTPLGRPFGAPQKHGGDGPTSEDTHGGYGSWANIYRGVGSLPYPLKKMGVGVGGPPGPPTPTPMVPRLRSDLVGKKV